MSTLDIESVRAFVAIAELKSFTRAAIETGTSQSALSVRLKRLEDKLQKKLIERTPRQVRLSVDGEMFLLPAKELLTAHDRALSSLSAAERTFRLGISCYVMGPETQVLLSRLKLEVPGMLIEVSVENSQILIDNLNQGLLDAIIVRSDDDRREGVYLTAETFGWFATRDFISVPGQPLPLANFSSECRLLGTALQLLKHYPGGWKEVFTGANIHAVSAAISGGIAIGILPHRLAPSHLVDVSQKFALPPLPPLAVVSHTALSDRKSREIIRVITRVYQDFYPEPSGLLSRKNLPAA